MPDPEFTLRPGFTMYSTAGEARKRQTCEFCGALLDPHQAVSSGICGRPECHAKKIEKVGTDLLARRRAQFVERMEGIKDAVAAEIDAALTDLGATREQASVVVTPYQDRPIEPLPEARRAAFRAHLEEIAAAAFGDDAASDDMADPDGREKHEKPEPAVVAGACGTCQGHCCQRGGDTALLLPADLARYRRRHPEATPEQIVETYLEQLPAESTRDGCVYQAVSGCSLPREMRQDICNSYYCESLRWLNRDYLQKRTGKVVFVAADDDDRPRRVAAFDPKGGTRRIAEVAPAAAEAARSEGSPGETG